MKHYEEPVLEIEKIEVADIITTSTPCEDWGGGCELG